MRASGPAGAAMWGGRFSEPLAAEVAALNASFSFDRRLAEVDVEGSTAYAGALRDAGWLDADEHASILSGLERIADEFASGTFAPRPTDEDIHSAVERRLHELIGETAGKLHAGRSRNDQVATDLRLYLVRTIDRLAAAIRRVEEEVVARARAHVGAIMPGYTHLRSAQPILFSHWLMSFFWKLERDRDRLLAARRRANVCPLGSGALAGNPFGLDRVGLAEALGFDDACENSLDGVEDRDFVCDVLYAASLLQTHLSALAETLIVWSSEAFGFIALDESHCTGSSLMPQKRNPDALELIRGKTGRVIGHLTALFVTLKGLPSGYNKDLQEDKEGLFDTLDTLGMELAVVGDVVHKMEVRAERMAAALSPGLLATDLADHLFRKGVPFRQAHRAVGKLVLEAERRGVPLDQLPPAAFRDAHSAFGDDVREVFDARRSVAHRNSKGGTAPDAVSAQIERAARLLHGDGEAETAPSDPSS